MTPCNRVDYSLPGSSVHGVHQAKTLEWVAMPSSRGPSQSRDQHSVSCISCIAGRFFITEPPGKRSSLSIFKFAILFKWASLVSLMVKNMPANAGHLRDMHLTPRLGRSPGGGHGNPLQCFCLENPLDRGAWRATVHRVIQSRTRLKRLSTHAGFWLED